MGLTIRDGAKAAGVSTATVSNVLNKTGKVGRRTHLLVLSTVKRLGYFPNVHARHLASHDSRTLGIIVSDIENPFFPEVIKSFEVRARQLGYDAILSDTNYDPSRTRKAAERMMEHNVRGVAVMTSEISLQLIHELARRRIAVTFLDLAPVGSYMSNLKIDYFSGEIIDFQITHVAADRREVEESDGNSSPGEFVDQLQADFGGHHGDTTDIVLHHSLRGFSSSAGIIIR